MTNRNTVALILAMALLVGWHPSTSLADETSAPPSELVIEVLRQGEGEVITEGDIASVHYTGWLYSAEATDNKGRQFDSSRSRGRPIPFTVGAGQVIAGWEQGVTGMRVGEQRRLIIPPDLAYGDRGFGGGVIPPGTTLVFDVELMGIE